MQPGTSSLCAGSSHYRNLIGISAAFCFGMANKACGQCQYLAHSFHPVPGQEAFDVFVCLEYVCVLLLCVWYTCLCQTFSTLDTEISQGILSVEFIVSRYRGLPSEAIALYNHTIHKYQQNNWEKNFTNKNNSILM